MRARDAIREVHGQRQPMPAPRFSRSQTPDVTRPRTPGSDNADVYADWGA
jgi:crotonobetainyl-CoA:carnitine CoA-transferase CaiB-like acyl-CoA transferase